MEELRAILSLVYAQSAYTAGEEELIAMIDSFEVLLEGNVPNNDFAQIMSDFEAVLTRL